MMMALISAAFVIPLDGYLDTIGANAARNSLSKASYGGQRIFGSVGSSISYYATGLASDHYQYTGMSPYTPCFYFLLAYLVITLIDQTNSNIKRALEAANDKEQPPNPPTTASLEAGKDKEQPPNPPTTAAPTGKLLWNMLTNCEVLFFYATIIVSGLSDNVSVYFTLLLVETEVPSTKAMNSFALVLCSISNMICFPLSGIMIRLLGAPTQAIMLSFLAYVIR